VHQFFRFAASFSLEDCARMKPRNQLDATPTSDRLDLPDKRSLAGRHWVLVAVACALPLLSHAAGPSTTLKRPTTEPFEAVQSLAFAPDGKTLAIGSSAPSPAKGSFPGDKPLPEGIIELWDLNLGKLTTTMRQSAKTENGDSLNQVGAIAFSPDGKWVIGGDIRAYTLWEVATGKQKLNWRAGIVEPLSPGWSPDGKWIALPTMVDPKAPAYDSFPHGVAVVDAMTGKAKMFDPIEIGYPRSARFSPDGKLVATAGHDCMVRVFDTQGLTNVFIDNLQTTLFAVGFSPDGHTLVAGSSWGGVLVIYQVDSEGGKFVIKKKRTSRSGAGEVHSVEFSPDGKRALSNSSGGMLLWDATNWATFKALPDACGCMSLDGNRIAVARNASPSEVQIWALSDLEKTMVVPER
jgi:WD40 repeat protein